MKKLIFISVMLFAFTAATFAQVSATATATAIIVGPIGITNTANMNFGNVAVGAALGTVILATDGSRTVTGGCTLPATAGSPAAATFNVTGAANYTYAITLPAGATTLDDGATHQMTVDNWQSDPVGTGDLGAGGSQTLRIGATLNVGASQTPGTYTSTVPFTVTVNYN